ncbi:outer membrane lipoprotein-sorting protein [Herbaspirillum sp. SJZ130]|nr:outer membrane lipoprotein-sorting protein [Herbaspirillum sp. SJZ130]TQK05707.1 outer membrane lipoprotein-sorting protein [Herbaspirillum sp. SJZ106]
MSAAALLATIPLIVLAQEIDTVDAASILEKVDAIRSPSENFVFTVKVNSLTSTLEGESEFEVSVHNRTKSLVLYRQPIRQRGRALLLDGPNMWIYIPGTNRPVRISPQQQLTGAVSNADVARVVFSLDYCVELVEKQHIDDLPALRLELRARQNSVPYQYVQLWITQKDLRPLKADFFSLSKKLIRTIRYEGYRNVLGQQRPTILKIVDAINPTVKATLTYSNFKIQDTPPEHYQPSYLGRLAN